MRPPIEPGRVEDEDDVDPRAGRRRPTPSPALAGSWSRSHRRAGRPWRPAVPDGVLLALPRGDVEARCSELTSQRVSYSTTSYDRVAEHDLDVPCPAPATAAASGCFPRRAKYSLRPELHLPRPGAPSAPGRSRRSRRRRSGRRSGRSRSGACARAAGRPPGVAPAPRRRRLDPEGLFVQAAGAAAFCARFSESSACAPPTAAAPLFVSLHRLVHLGRRRLSPARRPPAPGWSARLTGTLRRASSSRTRNAV